MSAGTSVRLIGPYYELSHAAGRFWCVSRDPVRLFSHPGGKLVPPRDLRGRIWPVKGSRLLYKNSRSKLALWCPETKKNFHEATPDPETDVTVSSNGEWLTYHAKSLRLVLRSSTGELRMQTDVSSIPIFSPGGDMLALWVSNVHRVGGGVGWVRVLDLERKAVQNFDMATEVKTLGFLSRDELVGQDEADRLVIFSRSERLLVRKKTAPGHSLIDAAGGRFLVSVAAYPGRHRIIDGEDFQVAAELHDSASGVFSPDGSLLAYHNNCKKERTHKLRLIHAVDGTEVAAFEIVDEALQEYNPSLEMQIRFHENGKQVAALINGEELRVWSLRTDRWQPEVLAPASGAGKDTYINLDVLDQTLNVASSAIRGIGGFFSKVVKQAKESNEEEPAKKKKSSSSPHWLRSAGMKFPEPPPGPTPAASAEESMNWLRRRAEELKDRGPEVLPRSLSKLNNRALRARIALNSLEPFLVRLEEGPPPYGLSMDETYKCLEAVRAFLDVHGKGSFSVLQMFGFLELLTRDDFNNRKAAAEIYEEHGIESYHAYLSDMIDPEQQRQEELEKARALVDPLDELELWVVPDFCAQAELSEEEAGVLQAALLTQEEALRTACARVGNFNRKVRRERIQWLAENALTKPEVNLPLTLKQKLERAFNVRL